jgi:hypothetical protein
MKEYKALPNPVQKNMQAEILNSLHEHMFIQENVWKEIRG